ncbi:MAG: hypothetical protein RR224_01085 [Clostridia bacterium]
MECSVEKHSKLREAAKPLVDYLQAYYHPHTKIIVEFGSVEIVEGVMAETFEAPD